MPLYPAGLTLEGTQHTHFVILPSITIFLARIIYLALPHITRSKVWSLELPNVLNVAFDFSTFLWVYLVLFVGGSELFNIHDWTCKNQPQKIVDFFIFALS